MKTLPSDVRPYHSTPGFTETTMPGALLREHTSKPGTSELIHVIEGELGYRILEPIEACVRLRPGGAGIVEPTIRHCVELRWSVLFHAAFHVVPKLTDDPAQTRKPKS
ncbi:MAG: DUF1971 domain-containing protein [Gallionella sp.]